MADIIDFFPIRAETVDSVRARLDADANSGLDPESELWLDTTPGGFWHDVTQACVLEFVRLWDFLAVEVPAAMFVQYAWDTYLDEHGDGWTLPRKGSVRASGEVTFSGVNGTIVSIGTEVGTVQTDPDEEPVSFVTTAGGTIAAGVVSLPVEATSEGAHGNVGAATVTQVLSPIDDITSVTNAAAMTGGADIETDEEYRDRLIRHIATPQGAGNVGDYERWALEEAEIGFVTVEPIWSGPGTVRVIITDRQNRPSSAAVIAALQAKLDPVAGEGQGLAPVGAIVTVATPANLAVDVEANVTLLAGYTLDGALGTIALEDAITEAIISYVDRLPPGGDVIIAEIISVIMSVPGVSDVTGIELNNVAANLSVSALQIALTDVVTLT